MNHGASEAHGVSKRYRIPRNWNANARPPFGGRAQVCDDDDLYPIRFHQVKLSQNDAHSFRMCKIAPQSHRSNVILTRREMRQLAERPH